MTQTRLIIFFLTEHPVFLDVKFYSVTFQLVFFVATNKIFITAKLTRQLGWESQVRHPVRCKTSKQGHGLPMDLF